MKEGTTLGARAQSAIQRAAVLYKPRLATFNLTAGVSGSTASVFIITHGGRSLFGHVDEFLPHCMASHLKKEYC
jgi:hypothetical protein